MTLALEPDDIHVWQTDLEDISTDAFARQILARYLDLAPDEVPISYGELGKPVLAGSSLHLSPSKSGNIVGVAVARRALGFDIETVDERLVDRRLIERVLTPNERDHLEGFRGGSRATEFFRMWVRKEAFAKAVGTGLTGGVERISVGLPAPDGKVHLPGGTAQTWFFADTEVPEGYVASVAAPGRGLKVTAMTDERLA